MNLKENFIINSNDHYLCKYGFKLIEKEQILTPVGGSGISTYISRLSLEENDVNWDVKIESQKLPFNNNEYLHLEGSITKTDLPTNFSIKSKNSFFEVFLNSKDFYNFFTVCGTEDFKHKIQKIEPYLLELRDKDVKIEFKNGCLMFSFSFSSYFINDFYDYIYFTLKELIS
jgi:hypothetical protein